jgi:carbon monoxide dehydrogenase subunit G
MMNADTSSLILPCKDNCEMKSVQCTTTIHRPVNEVFRILTDHDCDARWMLGVTGTERLTSGEMRQGTKMICKFGVGPLTTMKANAIIDEFEPGRRFVRRRVGGLMAMSGEFTTLAEGKGTRVRWTMDVGLNVRHIGFVFSPLLAQWMKMSMVVSLKKLKAFAESGQYVLLSEREHVVHAS